jgi:hypothetical protein
MVLQKSPLRVALKLLVAAHTHLAEIKCKISPRGLSMPFFGLEFEIAEKCFGFL